MKKFLGLASVGLLTVGVANAGQITVANSDITLSGAVTTGYFYSTNTDSNNHDSFKVSNFLVGLSSEAKDGGIGFTAGFGTVLLPTVYDGGLTDNKAILSKNFGIIYGYLTYIPVKNLSIDAGLLTTNIGYELATSFTNPNITYGAVWYAQPLIYPGVRATYQVGDIKFYAEVSKDKGYVDGNSSLQTSGAYAVGSIGNILGVDYVVSYYDYTAYKNLVDIVLSKEVHKNLKLGLDFDYQWLDKTAKISGHDDKGYGVALYLIPQYDKFSTPIRLEYINDGSKGKESGIYNYVSKAYTITVTPTYKPTKNSYIRAEVSYINSDNKIFADKNGNQKDTKSSAALELGLLF
ncbi:MAG: porin [Hydrogenothermaceae bacterium]|nr:porin [Hydrogenothermaceae bacterium]